MKLSPLLVIVLSLFLFACSKNVGEPGTQKTSTVLESRFLEKNLGATVLKITMEPVVTCYSYSNGEAPRPCEILINVTCTLSTPIQKSIQVSLGKLTTDSLNGLLEDPEVIGLYIAPGTKKIMFRTNLPNLNNNNIPDVFRITAVSVNNKVL